MSRKIKDKRHTRSVIKKHRKTLLSGKDTFICCGCREEFVDKEATVDHIRPLEKGGALHDIRNMQLMCAPCNSFKGSKWDGASGWPKSRKHSMLLEKDLNQTPLLLAPTAEEVSAALHTGNKVIIPLVVSLPADEKTIEVLWDARLTELGIPQNIRHKLFYALVPKSFVKKS